MSRSQDIIERLRREHAGSFTGSLQEAAGDASVVHVNNVLRDEVACLRAGLEAIEAGADPRRVAHDTLADADTIVREGGS